MSQGIGVKALKTSLTGTGSLGAQGSAYIGLGVDGPLFVVETDSSSTGSSEQSDANGPASSKTSTDAGSPTGVSTQSATQKKIPKTATGSPQGMASLEAYISGNVVTGSAISSLFGVNNPSHSYVSWGANFKLYVTDSIGIQVQYASALDSGIGRTIGHVAMFTIGYAQNAKAASKAQTQDSPTSKNKGD
jgi:hypothetical protein